MPFLKFALDYDDLSKEEVDEEAKQITGENPSLGPPTIEQSEGGNYHVTWHRSHLKTFEEGYNIAIDSKADKNWLDICKKYQVFALFTHQSLELTMKLRQSKRMFQLEKGSVDGTRLIITPENINEHRRILGICESMKDDSTWTWKLENTLGDNVTRIVIGCLDNYQANRRVRFLREKCGIQFKEEIV